MPKKGIGLWSAISIGVGGMVGAGIFSILGTACQIGGNAVYVSFILAGLVALFSTYSYAKLGVRYPSAGGPVEFLVQGFGSEITSGGLNILLWLGYVLALSLYARAFAAYAMTFFPTSPSILLNIWATSIILIFVGVNFIGAKAVGSSELLIVSIKVGILVLFAIIWFLFYKA
jgi:amino acid transporter